MNGNEEARTAAINTVDEMASRNTSAHDAVAAGTAAGVAAAAHEGANATGTSSVPTDSMRDPVLRAEVVPATAEQRAVDESYKGGDSPYEFSQGRVNTDEYKAQADRVYAK